MLVFVAILKSLFLWRRGVDWSPLEAPEKNNCDICWLQPLCKWEPHKEQYMWWINGNTDGPWEIPSGVQKYTFSELAKATGNFSEANEIGAGGFGKVFKGTLDDGKMVAIKRASQQSLQGTTEFRNEVLLLSRLHHRHLVRLEGFCDDKGLQVLAGILYGIFNIHPVRISFAMFNMLFLFHPLQFLT